MFRVFVSYSSFDKKKVSPIRSLLSSIFKGKIKFLYDDEIIHAGANIESEIKNFIKESNLFLFFASNYSGNSLWVTRERELAEEFNVPIIPIIVDPKLSSIGLFKGKDIKCIKLIKYSDFIEFEKIIDEINKYYIRHIDGDLHVINDIESLINSIVDDSPKLLKLFLIDGGTTFRRIFAKSELGFSRKKNLEKVEFLFLDFNFMDFIMNSPFVLDKDKIPKISSDKCQIIYESLLQASRTIHNNGPHTRDVEFSVESLKSISSNIRLDIRKTSHLPIYRMIITEKNFYYTHFMLSESGIECNTPISNYFTLKIGRNNQMYRIGLNYFDNLFQNSPIVFNSKK